MIAGTLVRIRFKVNFSSILFYTSYDYTSYDFLHITYISEQKILSFFIFHVADDHIDALTISCRD